MQEPSVRNVAVLPVVAVVTGAVIVLSTLVGQGVSASEECPPGSHVMPMGGMDMGGDSTGGMDHSAHMAMGAGKSECMPGIADSSDMPAMNDSTMPGMSHDPKATRHPSGVKSKAATSKKTAKDKKHSMRMH